MKNFKIDTQLFAGDVSEGGASKYVGEVALQQLVSRMKQYVDNKEITLEDSVLENSSNGVKSSGIYTALTAKQNLITANSKLSADLVDDTSTTHKFVTAAQITTWTNKQNALTFDNTPTSNSNNPVKSGGVYSALSGKQDVLTFDTTPTNGSTNPVTSDGVFDADEAIRSSVTTINSKIPSQASSSNQLADKAFVNSSINALAAYYITKNAAGDPFATKAELSAATTFYSGGATRTPTTNDYCLVLADESKQSATGVDPTTRYSYQGSQWEYQYTVNDTPLTAAQLAALNSGITSSLVTQIGTNQSNISTLQTNVSTLQGSSHTHSNKSVLDGITSAKVTSWDIKQDAMTPITTAEVDALFS